jgi:hypothetical protein
MMAEGKNIDVAVKKTSHSIHWQKQSHQTKSQEFPKNNENRRKEHSV